MKSLKEASQLTGIKLATLKKRVHRKTLKAKMKYGMWFLSDKQVEELKNKNP